MEGAASGGVYHVAIYVHHVKIDVNGVEVTHSGNGSHKANGKFSDIFSADAASEIICLACRPWGLAAQAWYLLLPFKYISNCIKP